MKRKKTRKEGRVRREKLYHCNAFPLLQVREAMHLKEDEKKIKDERNCVTAIHKRRELP